MYYIFLAAIVLTILRIVILGKCRKRKKEKAGKVALHKNIIELSKKGKK
jgi:hypothetical protein